MSARREFERLADRGGQERSGNIINLPLDMTWGLCAQVAVGLPFLAGNASAYLRGAYNLGRNLLWDKSRVFKFVGRGEGGLERACAGFELSHLARGSAAGLANISFASPDRSTPGLCADAFAAPPLHALLLLLTAASLGLLLYKSEKRWCEARDHRRHRERGGTCSRLGGAGSGTDASDCRTGGKRGAEECPQEAARGGRISTSGADASDEQKREVLFALLASNQLVVGWARALYTPFLAWNFYALPLVLALAGVSKVRFLPLRWHLR